MSLRHFDLDAITPMHDDGCVSCFCVVSRIFLHPLGALARAKTAAAGLDLSVLGQPSSSLGYRASLVASIAYSFVCFCVLCFLCVYVFLPGSIYA